MDEHGHDVDERAAAALEALRGDREADPDSPPGGPLPALAARWWDQMGPGGRRLWALAAAAVVALGVGVVAWWALRPAPAPVSDAELFAGSAATTPVEAAPLETGTTTTEVADVVVHAAGAVQRPGLYRLGAGARVDDLLAAAGGPAPDADLDRVNLAETLGDGQRLFVPRLGEEPPVAVGPVGGERGATDEPGPEGSAEPIDVNRAGETELEQLPGIGPATATAIVEHRERHGPFSSVESLLDVRGIGPAKLEGLRDLVVVG